MTSDLPYGIPNGTFESFKLSMCKQSPQLANKMRDFPLVLFSPGAGNSRLLYSAMAQSVASHGYIVVTIDHPYDAAVVEYPEGTLVLAANISSDAQYELDVQTRAQDISFVLDQLSNATFAHHLLPSTKKRLETNKVTLFGHSLGGATVASAMLNDTRIAGGINLDGTFFGPVIKKGLAKPFLLFGHEGKNQSTDDTWAELWPHLQGWKLELMLDGAQHGTFSDLPMLVEVLGLGGHLPAGVGELLGSIEAKRAMEVITAYVVAFFEQVLRCKASALLQGPSAAFPEVDFVAEGS